MRYGVSRALAASGAPPPRGPVTAPCDLGPLDSLETL